MYNSIGHAIFAFLSNSCGFARRVCLCALQWQVYWVVLRGSDLYRYSEKIAEDAYSKYERYDGTCVRMCHTAMLTWYRNPVLSSHWNSDSRTQTRRRSHILTAPEGNSCIRNQTSNFGDPLGREKIAFLNVCTAARSQLYTRT